MFNKIEDKGLRFILMIIFCLIMVGVGFWMIRFLPALFKLVGAAANFITVWMFIKYIRKEFSSSEKEEEND